MAHAPLPVEDRWARRVLLRAKSLRLRQLARNVGVARALDDGLVRWKLRARKSSALRWLLANARQIPALSNVGLAELYGLAEMMGQIHCDAGEVIIRQGEVGDAFYVVEWGWFRATVRDTHAGASQGKVVSTFGAGRWFGELALLHNAPRSATVECTADGSRLWVLDRATFRRYVMGVRLRRAASEVHFLAHLSEVQLDAMADAMFEVRCTEGEIVIWQGEIGDNLYLVEHGSFDALVLPAGSRPMQGGLEEAEVMVVAVAVAAVVVVVVMQEEAAPRAGLVRPCTASRRAASSESLRSSTMRREAQRSAAPDRMDGCGRLTG